MSKGVPNKEYKGKFKQMVVEAIRGGLSHKEAERQYELPHGRATAWERIYLEEGPAGLYVEQRGRASAANGTQKG